MLGSLVVAYLFCGGAGAGALCVSACASLLLQRSQFKQGCVFDVSRPAVSEGGSASAVSWAYAVGLGLLLFGIACLVFDVGRTDRVLSLFASPHATYLTVGSFVLIALAVAGGVLVSVSFLAAPGMSTLAYTVVRVFTIVLGLAGVLYTGMLLASMRSVALWSNPLVPIMFVLSSLSCGASVLSIASAFSALSHGIAPIWVVRFARVLDIVLLILEGICVICFTCTAFAFDNGVSAAARMLVLGEAGQASLLWWAGYVACGIMMPLMALVVVLCLERRLSGSAVAFSVIAATCAVSVLAGSACLRAGIVEAAAHPDLGFAAYEAGETTQRQGDALWRQDGALRFEQGAVMQCGLPLGNESGVSDDGGIRA